MPLNVGGSDSLYWKTKLDTQGLQKGALKSKGIIAGLASSITKTDVFFALGVSAGLAFKKISKLVYDFSKDFEHAMREVMTISDATKQNLEGISAEIVNMSKTVPDTAIKLSKAFYQIVSAGYDGKKAMEILRTSTELAVATVTDTFTAADSLTYVMNAYGKAAGTASEISDKLFTIIKLGKVKMEELGPTLSMVTGLAAEAGMSFNDLGAFYAEAVKKIQPHIVSTGIRGFVTALLRASKEGQESAKAAKEMGIEFDIATLKSKGLEYMLKQMAEATEGQKQKLMELFPNVRGLIGLLAIMTNEGANFAKSLDALENSLGNNKKAFEIMVDTTTNQLAILKNNVMAKLKPLGDSILKQMNNIASGINIAMSGANDELSKLARSYSELTDTLQRKQNRIDNLIKTVEGLRDKTKLTREETSELDAAERALGVYYPTFGKVVEGVAGSYDILNLAKEGSIDLSIKIMELELAQAKIEMRRAELAKSQYYNKEDEDQKEIDRLQRKFDLFRHTLSIKQIIELQTTGEIKEELRLETALSNAIETRALKQEQLIQNVKATTAEVNALTDSLKILEETREKPIITTIVTKGEIPETTIPIAINLEEVEKQLKYMASQYKKYLSDVAEFGEKYVEENNAQLYKEGQNYGQFLSDSLEKYKDNSDLKRQISDDIYEYNKGILVKRKEAEKELFDLLATDREKDLAAKKEEYDSLTEKFEEGTAERLDIDEQYRKDKLAINKEYDDKEAKLRLDLFKVEMEKLIGETDKAYKLRLEAAKKALGKETKLNKEYFEFIKGELEKIAKLEKEEADKKEETLESYLSAYKTTEEKIAAINKETAEALKATSDEVTKNRIKNIEKQRIAAIEFADAKQEIDKELAKYEGKLNNKQLEEYIKILEEMKIEYKDFTEFVIMFNEEIAESQKKIWENTRDEINQTADLLHNLAGVVSEFDTELGQMINNIANLVSGIGQITFGFATGNIFGILGGIINLVSSIFNLFIVHHSDVAELEEELHEITLELQEQQNILSQAIGEAKPEAIQNMIDLLNEQIATYNEMIEAEKEAYGQFLWWTWDETDQAKIEQWLADIQNINAEIAILNQQYQEILTGTTASAIAEAIAEGFSQGLDSAQIFADTFNDMMKKAIIDAFKRTIITKYIEDWYNQFFILSGGLGEQLQAIFGGGWSLYEGGLTPETIATLQASFQSMLGQIETEWGAIQDIMEAAGIDLFEEITIPEIIEQAEEAMEAIAGITEETIADSIADGFYQGLTSAEVFADTFKDMMQRAIIDAFKKTIITRYLKNWYDQFNILSEGGFTVAEIEALAGVYQNIVGVASAQWKAMEAILEAAGIGIELEEEKKKGLTGAIAGITEETAGILAGQFQAIRINTVEIVSNMENIIIINSRIADNTEFNRYLTHLASIDNKLSDESSSVSELIRAIGGS